LPRRWTEEQRQQAQLLAERIGVTKAAKQLGMPYGTVAAMMSRTRNRVQVVERVAPDVAPILNSGAAEWDGTQQVTAARYGRLVAAQLTVAEELLRQERYREHKDVILASAIATDKAQLLSGHATSRSESRSLVVRTTAEKVRALVDRLPAGAQGLVIPSRALSEQGERDSGTEIVPDAASD